MFAPSCFSMTQQPTYSPHNPHPLFTLRRELVWEGKYDEYGNRREVDKERAIESGFDFIDFWAIDFNWHPGKPFTHNWQDYRTRKDRSLKTISDAGYAYPAPGKYTACVKVVDTFGCDTSITVVVEV